MDLRWWQEGGGWLETETLVQGAARKHWGNITIMVWGVFIFVCVNGIFAILAFFLLFWQNTGLGGVLGRN